VSRFADRVALVTGAAQGIGLASALRLGREGARVALLDRNADAVETAAEALRSDGLDARGWVCDVTAAEQVEAAVAGAVAAYGGLDVVHANAGVLLPAAVVDEELARWETTLATNVTGVFLTLRAAIPHLVARGGGGAIVTTSSTAALVAEPAFAGYCTSKAAVAQLTRQVALDLAERGVRANAVNPGWIDTRFSDPILAGMSEAEIEAEVRATVPMGRMGTVEEVAAAVAFLASDEASYLTGHCLVIDGGLTVR
jgi:NAD(P)-dependent dehydrogenase (short-subunit alcohol dehydrogenase family)